jgi:hypothetical protein
MQYNSHRQFSAFGGFVQIGGSASRKVRKNRSPRLTSRPIDLLHTEMRVNRFRLLLIVFGVACLLAVKLKTGAVDERPLESGAYFTSGTQPLHQRLSLSSDLLASANSPQELPKQGMEQARLFFAWPQSSKVRSAPPPPRPGSIAATTRRSSNRKISKSPTDGIYKCLKRFRRFCRGILPRTTQPATKSRQTTSTN